MQEQSNILWVFIGFFVLIIVGTGLGGIVSQYWTWNEEGVTELDVRTYFAVCQRTCMHTFAILDTSVNETYARITDAAVCLQWCNDEYGVKN